MDKLDDNAIGKLNDLTYKNTQNLFKEKLNVIFYDCTTLYFESFKEDDLKCNGYSKDCKFGQPQVLVAFLVTKEGLPIGYKVFPGNVYEGHTLIPALEELNQKYNLNKIILVADSAMLNQDNLNFIQEKINKRNNNLICDYILGARLKNLPKELKLKILDHSNYTEVNEELKIAKFEYQEKTLIVTHSNKRAGKDAHDRDKAIKSLLNKIRKSKNYKTLISNYGYKKYIEITGNSSVTLDEEKIKADALWDGLHGVLTNSSDMSETDVIAQYKNLWQIEESFRITKHDLKVRPIFHWKPNRVKAHLAICFIAFSLVRYLEYRVKLQYKKLSPNRIKEALLRAQTSILYDKNKKIIYGLPGKITEETKKIYNTMSVKLEQTPYIISKM